MTDQDVAAYAWLLQATEPPVPNVVELVAECGPVEAVARICHGVAPEEAMLEVKWPDVDIRSDLDSIASGTWRLITPDSDEWPSDALQALSGRLSPPLALWVRGTPSLAALTERAILLTSCRATDEHGERVAGNFGYEIATLGATVVSGGSFGADASAHRGAMAGGGPTVAVVARGATGDRRWRSDLLDSIAGSGGLVVSEYPPGALHGPSRSDARLRLMVALAQQTVLVPGIEHRLTGRVVSIAHKVGRPVLAVPGPELVGGQVDAATLTSGAPWVTLTSRAGTGSGEVLHAVAQAYKADGWSVIGVAPFAFIALRLGAQILARCYTLAQLKRHIDRGSVTIDHRTLIVVGEASEVELDSFALLAQWSARGGARVLMGGAARLIAV